MAERIESLYRISAMKPIEGYSKKEIAERIKNIEKQSQEYQLEKAKYLSHFPDSGEDLNFTEELAKLLGEEIEKPSTPKETDEEEGFILDIGNKK